MTKSIFTLIVFTCLSASTILSQDSIPNHNFESWITYYNPIGWETTNLLLPPGTLNCFQSDESYEGDYAIQLKTIDVFGSPVPGVATLGTMEMNNTSGGIPFSERPMQLTGYYKHLSAGDEVFMAVQFFKEGELIGGGEWSTTDSIPEYIEFSISISYSSEAFPDTMNITFLTDAYQIGSGLFIDALSFEYETTGIKIPIRSEATFSCYPNPSKGTITIDVDTDKKVEVMLYTLHGQLLKKTDFVFKRTTINLDGIKPGVYFIVASDGLNRWTKKIEKIK